jgi:ABC-type multidrug transport system fused ATPase/permease subunit
MARKRRPSIGLIILFIILLLAYFFAGAIVNYASDWSTGSFVYSYSQGTEPVVSLTLEFPQNIADAIIFQSPSGWTTDMTDNTLCLAGGTLNPGDSLTVNYKLKEYISSGTSSVTVTSTTASGAEMVNNISFFVADATLLYIAGLISQYSIWFLILAIIVLIAMIALFLIGKKKEEVTVNVKTTPT